jgi:IS5 family transposase
MLEIAEDRNEEDTDKAIDKYVQVESSDPDAKWLKKGKKSYFGYKGFVTTDGEGFITNAHLTPANKAEVRELEHILPQVNAKRVLTDKGYASAENRRKLKQAGVKDGIMYKAAKNQQLSKWQKLFNKLVSKSRYVIEQSFGTLKRRFRFARASYMGLAKVCGQLNLKAICSNLLKALNKVAMA